jgi:hypothetical protein
MTRKKKIKEEVFYDEEPKTEYSIIKPKTLFDHINVITQTQDPKYFSKITDADKKTWSTYMILRFLSMNYDWVELVAELDPITTGIQLRPDMVYRLLIDILPKGRVFLKYMKSENDVMYNKTVIELLVKYYEISKKQAMEYLDIFYSTPKRLESLKKIISMYGKNEKEIDKLIKI